LNASACDKTTGKSNRIAITNDKGHLSKEEIERMISEAEQYKSEDEAASARIAAKNRLESYSYNLLNSINYEKKKLEEAANEAISWLDDSQEASKEEYEEKQRGLEDIVIPIMQKLYLGAGGTLGAFPSPDGAPGGFPGAGGAGQEDGPSVEEVD
jgi:heat shock protein 1/8